MPVAVTLIFGVVVLAASLIGLIWAIVFLLSFYAYIAAAIYLIVRSNRKLAELESSVEREAKSQRMFNQQEMRAWRASLDIDGQKPPERGQVLRRLDRTPGPRQK